MAGARNSVGEKGGKKTSESLQGMWLGGARKGSHWLCYAGPLAERQKSEISGNQRRPKSISLEKNSWRS